MIYVSMSHATFGLVVADWFVTGAPPIARWAIGVSARFVWDYFQRRGATVEWVPEPTE